MGKSSIYILITSVMLFVCSCAAIQPADEKIYELDDHLELVPYIHNFSLISWETVDRQSFILKTGVNDYYLIVLVRPSYSIMNSADIIISSIGSTVKSGFDDVTVVSSNIKETYRILKIYKFKNYQQAKELKAQLSGKSS